MILIYSNDTSPRLQYTCKFIFEDVMGSSYTLSTHRESFEAHEGCKINYSIDELLRSFRIIPQGLLTENMIRDSAPPVRGNGAACKLFPDDSATGFDMFSAVFYLISRYEEYLPFEADDYGRFPHNASLAHREGFLKFPIVDIWCLRLAEGIKQMFPGKDTENLYANRKPKFLPGYDIDIAWSFRNKGFLRNAAGFVFRPGLQRLAVLAGIKQDPYDNYVFFNGLHESAEIRAQYFFIASDKNNRFDKQIPISDPAMQALIREHVARYEIGLHPSFASAASETVLQQEKKTLEQVSGKAIRASRQHFLLFNMPGTFRHLISAGISDEHSMGYSSINGFRAGTATSFYWYDLAAEQATKLRMHPFCFMDTTARNAGMSAADAFEELSNLMRTCTNLHADTRAVLHNNFYPAGSEWRKAYAEFTTRLP